MTRDKVLKDAAAATIEREGEFGSPKENLGLAANLFTQYLKSKHPHYELDANDVAMLVILFKVARVTSGYTNRMDFYSDGSHHDTLVDIAGYAAIASEVQH